MEDFILKDNIRHKAYNFPKTVLSFKKKGAPPDEKSDVLFMDGFQTHYEIEPNENGYLLKLLADLAFLGEHHFSWKKGKNVFEKLGADNGIIRVESLKDGLFKIWLKTGESFTYKINTKLKLVSQKEQILGGTIETTIIKTLVFENKSIYKFTLKLKKELDYLEIFEEMSGFQKDQAMLCIEWENFSPDFRYTLDRKEEKIDAYIDDEGKFPFVINPFMPKASWWHQRYAAYADKKSKLWSGILLHDLKHFNDGEYAVWGSKDSLAFSLYENRIEGAVANGERAFMHVLCADKKPEALGFHYMRYYSVVSLNKVKDYILDWDDDKNEYPKYFKIGKDTKWGGFYGDHTGKASDEDMMSILDRDATIFASPENIAPVSCRAYRSSWAQTFDLTAKELTDVEFKRVRAAMALVCYTFADENYYPVENMLAGHPNFLTDVLGTIAVFASLLGKKHPMHDKWLSYYEIAMARNLKYHIRPDVEKWNALGGRWTENIGAYMTCMLQCTVYDCHMIYKLNGGEMPVLYPHIKNFVAFLLNMQMAENAEGRRLYARHGAHAATGAYGGEYGHGFCLMMIELADMLEFYEPQYSEYILHNFRKDSDFSGVISSAGIYGETYKNDTQNRYGTSPQLYSCKYTGLGFMLRDHVNTDGEMSVFLQQIDEGPNYRWGRAAQGGCGEIYYYAVRRQFTDHAPEDVGDENRGDVQSCTNFGVLVGHEYKSVGRNDLTEPLMDFGFIKYARVNAGEYSAPYYKYRSVMMVENRYIAVYDAVADLKQQGRFTWAQNQKNDFPLIKNIRPGVNGVLDGSGIPVDKHSDYKSKYEPCRVMNYDGQGDFFTIVTHLRDYHDERPLYSIDKKEYGAELVFPQTRDKVFNDQSRIYIEEKDYAFDGYAGYMTEASFEKRLALFNGSHIRTGNIAITIAHDKKLRRGLSGVFKAGEMSGKAVFEAPGEVKIAIPKIENGKVFIDGKDIAFEYSEGLYAFIMPQGNHSYNIGSLPEIDKAVIDRVVVNHDGFTAKWQNISGAEVYEISVSEDLEYTYKIVGEIKKAVGENAFTVSGLKQGKYHVRVCGLRGDKRGEYSHAYPVYVTLKMPHQPEGLRVVATNGKYLASWGEVLGSDFYNLYKKGKKNKLIYSGRERKTVVEDGEYFVTAVSGNGESAPSLVRSTNCERARWDNHPEIRFVRDCRSHEHGYGGFDYIKNPDKPTLDYPED